MSTLALSKFRTSKAVRNRNAQVKLNLEDLILPYFVVEGKNIKREIRTMPGVYHFSVDRLLKELSHIRFLRRVLLFGVSKKKDKIASEGYSERGVLQKAARALKKEFDDLIVISDVCLCGYMSHGHCGIIDEKSVTNNLSPAIVSRRDSAKGGKRPEKNKRMKEDEVKINNKKTLEVLAKIAISHARAGVDFVAPSAMADGQVKAIRKIMDKNDFTSTGILAYSAKYASGFYAPFRGALNSTPKFGNRKTYQMDFRNSDEAIQQIKQDIAEGADMVMVKPALAYLDIIYRAKQAFDVPIVAYNVSGEYTMIKNICKKDKSAQIELAFETVTSIKRAGADLIITYWAKDLIKLMK